MRINRFGKPDRKFVEVHWSSKGMGRIEIKHNKSDLVSVMPKMFEIHHKTLQNLTVSVSVTLICLQMRHKIFFYIS